MTSQSPSVSIRDGVTWRSVLIGTLLIPVNALWLAERAMSATTLSLLFNAVFIVLVLTLLNRLFARFFPQRCLCQGELLVIYTMLAVATTLCATDSALILAPMLAKPFHEANSSNRWAEIFFKYLPRWLLVPDGPAVRAYYDGNSTFYKLAYIQAWIRPALWWSLFSVLLLFVMLCLNAILRKQWTEHERLNYPIVQLPFEITRGAGEGKLSPLFSNRLFWVGFTLASGADLVNSLNLYFPSISTILSPGFGIAYYDLGKFLTAKPLNAIGWTPAAWYPFLVGLGMLLPVDFLFSVWFFYIFWKAEKVLVVGMAWDSDPRFPYIQEQAFGAYIAFLVITLTLARGYFKQVLLCALGRPSTLDDRGEPLSYRWALLGLLAGTGGLVAFSCAAGMSAWMALAFFGIYFCLAVAITRMRAEMGTPIHDLHFTGPDWMLTGLIGSRNISPANLTIFSIYFWFNRAYRNMAMPHQLEGFKLAERTRTSHRRLAAVMVYTSALGALSGIWAILHMQYSGPESPPSWIEAYDRLSHWLSSPTEMNPLAIGAAVIGLLICLLLQYLRIRLTWWPFHPLAFAVTSSWQINLVWSPLLLAWVLKTLILRYGGRQGYARSLPFFFGLMLGQFTLGGITFIIGAITHIPTYYFAPWT